MNTRMDLHGFIKIFKIMINDFPDCFQYEIIGYNNIND